MKGKIEWERLEIYLFRKIKDTKVTFHAKTDTIKDRKEYGPKRSRRY